MNKFVKYSAIAACILVLGGTGIATAAFALGADPVRIWDFVEERFDGPDRYLDYRTSAVEVEITMADTWAEAAIGETAAETMVIGSAEIVETSGNETGVFVEDLSESVYSEVTDLDIRIVDGTVEVYTDQEIKDMIVRSNGSADHLRYSNMQDYKKLEIHASAGEEYQIAIPTDWEFKEIDVKLTGGFFEGNGIRAKEAEFSAEGGEIQIMQQGGKTTALESKGGVIYWTGEGEISRHLDIESTDGGEIAVNLDIGVEVNQIGYDAEYKDAVINFYGDIWEGFGNGYRNAQNGMPHLEMKAERNGSIMIQ